MTSQSPEVIAAIAGTMRSSISRRRLLHAAGLGSAAMVAAACGASDEALGNGGTGGGFVEQQVGAAEDMSAVEKRINWSNWPSTWTSTTSPRPTRPSRPSRSRPGSRRLHRGHQGQRQYFGKVRAQLKQGQDIGRDIIILTDWMAALWIRKGYVQKLDKDNMPNWTNLLPKLFKRSFDQGRKYSLTWQSGFAGLAWNKAELQAALGKDKMASSTSCWTRSSRAVSRCSPRCATRWAHHGDQGADRELHQGRVQRRDRRAHSRSRRPDPPGHGQLLRRSLESGDLIAVIGWSGDIIQLGGRTSAFAIPETGGTLWSDNMMVPDGGRTGRTPRSS